MKNIIFIFALFFSIPSFSQNLTIRVMEPTDTMYRFTQEKVDTSEMVWFDKQTIHNGYVVTTYMTCLFDNTGDLEGEIFTTTVKFLDTNKRPLDPRKIWMWKKRQWSETLLDHSILEWDGARFIGVTPKN